MKAVKVGFIVLASALLAMGVAPMSFAFHSGGVAECTGCHSMHAPLSANNLLLGTDDSSTCLNCHQNAADTKASSYHISTVDSKLTGTGSPLQRTPGGDFAWLKKTYSWTGYHGPETEAGSTHGHNIIAADYGYFVDDKAGSPGGSFPSAQLACTSCHDQHSKARRFPDGTIADTGAPIIGSGSYDTSILPVGTQAMGIYRLLRGNLNPVSNADFTGYPVAVAPYSYNRTEAVTQTRVAYGDATGSSNGASWGQWCATCHANMHSTKSGNLVHPIDEPLSGYSVNYAKYVSSGIMTGSSATSYLSLVPFATNDWKFSTLKPLADPASTITGSGPDAADKVMCLSCHRAHASGFPEMLRWNTESEFITAVDNTGTVIWPGTDAVGGASKGSNGRTSLETAAAYYDRPVTVFGAYQRQLCNKCHAKD